MPHFETLLETKLFAGDATGEFSGYGAVFGNLDTHKDLIKPGAFADSIAAYKAAGQKFTMYAMHGPALGGDPLPVGVWNEVSEDSKGLKVSGQIAAMDTDHGKRIYSLAKAGALSGLSIGYSVPPGGATYGTKSSEPKRTLHKLDLSEISLVGSPSNSLARISSLKTAALSAGDRDQAAASIAAAMRMHDRSMGSNYSEASPKDKALLMDHLRDAHEHLTGLRAPDGLESWTKTMLRDPDVKSALSILGAGLSGFSLTR